MRPVLLAPWAAGARPRMTMRADGSRNPRSPCPNTPRRETRRASPQPRVRATRPTADTHDIHESRGSDRAAPTATASWRFSWRLSWRACWRGSLGGTEGFATDIDSRLALGSVKGNHGNNDTQEISILSSHEAWAKGCCANHHCFKEAGRQAESEADHHPHGPPRPDAHHRQGATPAGPRGCISPTSATNRPRSPPCALPN